jgi:hypothetical protein
MKLSLNAHIIGQVTAGIVQVANLYGGIIPAHYQPVVALVVGVCQAIMAFVAHYSPAPDAPK